MKNNNYQAFRIVSRCKGMRAWLTKMSVLFVFVSLTIASLAQNTNTIKGIVLDPDGNTLPGATVAVKGMSVGVTTDMDGNFTLNLPEGAEALVFTFIGFAPQEVQIHNQKNFEIKLQYDAQEMDEVIVVGYGQQKKESVVGSISQTTGEVLERTGGVTNVGAALTGQLPGVITYASSGMPGGEDPQIIIRTQSSWNNSSPLILVDGIERSMSDVDISSVESISVLKDASATAVYGVRGANGVVLITTKRGKEGRANIQVRANTTMKIPSKLPAKYDAYDALKLRNSVIERELRISPDAWSDYTPMGIIDKYRNPANQEEWDRYPNVDWEDELFKDFAMSYNASVNISGGTKFVKYFSAVDFLSEGDLFKKFKNNRGYQPGYKYNRINVRSNLDFQLTKTTKFRSNLFGSNGVQQTPWGASSTDNAYWNAAYKTAPDAMRPIYSNGMWGWYAPRNADQTNSMFSLANSGLEKKTQTKITTDFILEQDLKIITKGLSVQGTYSIDNSFQEGGRGVEDSGFKSLQRMWVDPNTGVIDYEIDTDPGTQLDFYSPINWSSAAGSVNTGATYRRQYYSFRLNYVREFGKHNVTGLGLFSREKYSRGSEFAHFREDWVFRGTYSYGGKYFFEFNGAYNGSEKFGDNNRFAFFPSFSGGWMLSEESFMQAVGFLDMFKIRASWGRIGDDAVGGRWLYADQWTFGGNSQFGDIPVNSPYTYFRISSMGNPEISWETVEKRNIGIDYAFLDGLIAGSFDYFNDYRTDILVSGSNRSIPSFFGVSAPTANLGSVKSSGYEFEIRLSKMIKQKLRLWANINMTHAKNEIEFADDPQLYPDYQKSAGFAIGQTMSYIDDGYLASWDDVLGSVAHQTNNSSRLPGDYNIVDFNADGVIDAYDRTPYGYTGVPQNTYSTTVGLDWKGLNVSVQFYGVSNVSREVFFPTFRDKLNVAYVEGDYWTVASGDGVPFPRWNTALANFADGTRYRYDGSYLRLKTAEIGYTFSRGWISRIGMKSCKFYVSGNNLLLWTDMPDDRENNFGSQHGDSRSGAYPTVRRVNFGVDITF
ncbi:MAG: SusC/RagA family TonB-linked outer membrane protein [Bacteroidales bacterium]